MENSKIEWTHHTINFWWGCEKVSPACANCYAERQDMHFHPGNPWPERYQGEKATPSHWGHDAPRFIRTPKAVQEAFRFHRKASVAGGRARVFTNSMSDFFEDRGDLYIPRMIALDTMRQTPNLDWLILTKRPENIMEMLRQAEADASGSAFSDWLRAWISWKAPTNVWLGTTVENKDWADIRIQHLLGVPAAGRFLSCEPMLGQINLSEVPRPVRFHGSPMGWEAWLTRNLHWVVAGGESGPEARPANIQHIRSLRDQCALLEIPFLFKAWGEWAPAVGEAYWSPLEGGPQFKIWGTGLNTHSFEGGYGAVRIGRAKTGRLIDGVIHDAYPEALRYS